MSKILNRLCKWRTVFAGWQLGTRAKGDPEGDAVRDHREATILLRVEVSALIALLIQKKVFSLIELAAQMDVEAEEVMKMYEKRFPGFEATNDGITMDIAIAKNTMRGWRP